MIQLPHDALRGSLPPLVVPFRDGDVDFEVYAGLVDRQVAMGSHGVVVNGTTGEPSMLTVGERKRLAEVAVDAAAGRIPVVVASGSQSHADTVELSEHASKVGAAALLVVTPYFSRPPQRGLVRFYVDLARRSDVPLLMYHIPGRAGIEVTLDTLTAIVEAAPTFVGMKHASKDLSLVTDVLMAFGPEFRVLVGLEDLSYPMLALGASGMVNAIGNLVPEQLVALHDAVEANDLQRARHLHDQLTELNRSIFFDTNPIPLKYMLRRVGVLPTNEHRLPMVPAEPELEHRLDGVLERAGLLP